MTDTDGDDTDKGGATSSKRGLTFTLGRASLTIETHGPGQYRLKVIRALSFQFMDLTGDQLVELHEQIGDFITAGSEATR